MTAAACISTIASKIIGWAFWGGESGLLGSDGSVIWRAPPFSLHCMIYSKSRAGLAFPACIRFSNERDSFCVWLWVDIIDLG